MFLRAFVMGHYGTSDKSSHGATAGNSQRFQVLDQFKSLIVT